MKSLAKVLHDRLVYQRRIRAIAHSVSPLLDPGKVLDIGCGNGELAELIMAMRSDIRIFGLEVIPRIHTSLPACVYDGDAIPFPDLSFDSVLASDVLHHSKHPEVILEECVRVARSVIVVKDHFFRSKLQHLVLRVMDLGGNVAHGVNIDYNYFTRENWRRLIQGFPLEEVYCRDEVPGQYPGVFQNLLGRDIQFVAKLEKR